MAKEHKPYTKTRMHTMRTADEGTITLSISRKLAMSAFCTECLGWEGDPHDCTSPMCPLFPYRVRTQKTLRGDPGTQPTKKKCTRTTEPF